MRTLLALLLSTSVVASAAERDSSPHDRSEVVRLAAWETAVGATTLGALVSYNEDGGLTAFAGLVGGAAGLGGAALIAKKIRIDHARTTFLVGTQQLAMWHGGVLSRYLDPPNRRWGQAVPGGVALGAVVGTAFAVPFMGRDFDDGIVSATSAGAYWGLGLGGAAITMAYLWDEEADVVLPLLLASTDLGAFGGYLLGRHTGITRDQVQMANFGGVFGGAAAYMFGWTTENSIIWTEHTVAILITVGALAGAGGALLIERHVRAPNIGVGALISGTPDHVVVGLPMPMVVPSRDAFEARLSLVQLVF